MNTTTAPTTTALTMTINRPKATTIVATTLQPTRPHPATRTIPSETHQTAMKTKILTAMENTTTATNTIVTMTKYFIIIIIKWKSFMKIKIMKRFLYK